MPNEPLAQPTLKAVETLRPLRRLERLQPARPPRNPSPCGGCSPAAAQSASHPTRTPAGATSPPRHPASSSPAPWINPRRAFRDSFLLHSLSPQLSEEG